MIKLRKCGNAVSRVNFARLINYSTASVNKNAEWKKSKGHSPVALGEEVQVPVPWGTIAGKLWGKRDGFPVIGIHGWLDNAGTYDLMGPLLRQDLSLIAIDLPGHGYSSHFPQGMKYYYRDLLTCIRRVVKWFNWKTFSLMGHSMGGGLTVAYASLFPSEVQDIVMLDMIKPITIDTNRISDEYGPAIDHFLHMEKKSLGPTKSYSYEQLLDRLMRPPQPYNSVCEEGARCLLKRGARMKGPGELIATRDHRMHAMTLWPDHEIILNNLKNVRCRNLLILAKDRPDYEENQRTQEAIDIYTANCKEVRKILVEGNHYFHLKEPEMVANYINEFLTR